MVDQDTSYAVSNRPQKGVKLLRSLSQQQIPEVKREQVVTQDDSELQPGAYEYNARLEAYLKENKEAIQTRRVYR